jgi:hypothetical protein
MLRSEPRIIARIAVIMRIRQAATLLVTRDTGKPPAPEP